MDCRWAWPTRSSKAEGHPGLGLPDRGAFGTQGIRDRYYGPPSASQTQDRRHILVFHYSYRLPNPTPVFPILKWVLDGWEASGVTQFTTGNPLDPVCNTNQAGVENTDPSLSGITARAEPSLRVDG